MNGPHMFGVIARRLAKREISECERIADLCNVEFIYQGRVRGSETTGWFQCPNLGEPFNSATAKHVAECLTLAGIWGKP